MFKEQEKVVYPAHGVAKINRIIVKKVGDQETTFYELTFVNKDMTILVPTHNTEVIGLRPLSSQDKVNALFEVLAKPARKISSYELTASSWNKRHKEYQVKLRSGKLADISEIYRDLRHIALQKELSFGEKNLLNQTETMLVEEIAAVNKLEEQKAVEQLRKACVPTRVPQQTVSEL
jgi:CarD family transcriptional regulator